MHSVACISVSVSNEKAHVEAECEEAGPQQVTQGRQVGDGEVVGVHASAPHPVDHPVCQVEKDYHLEWDKAQENLLFYGFFCIWLSSRILGLYFPHHESMI